MDYKRIGKPQGDNSWQQELGWHMERSQGVGGSEIAALMDDSPWMTAFALWEYKTGKKESKDISTLPHIQRGVLGEKIARGLLHQQDKFIYVPHTWKIEDTPYRCSDDGYCAENNILLEIKCMSASAHEKFMEKIDNAKTYKQKLEAIPVYYLHQCLWNLFVSGASACRFISFNPETEAMSWVDVKPNAAKAKQYVKKVDKFWECVTKKIAPELSDKDQVDIKDDQFSKLENSWVQLKDEQDAIQERLGEIERSLKGFTGKHPRIKGRFVQITRTTRVGAVDYKRAFSEAGISPDDYRGEPTELIRISRVKADDV